MLQLCNKQFALCVWGANQKILYTARNVKNYPMSRAIVNHVSITDQEKKCSSNVYWEPFFRIRRSLECLTLYIINIYCLAADSVCPDTASFVHWIFRLRLALKLIIQPRYETLKSTFTKLLFVSFPKSSISYEAFSVCYLHFDLRELFSSDR